MRKKSLASWGPSTHDPEQTLIRKFIWPTLLPNFPSDVGTSAMPGPFERQRSLLSDLLERVTLDPASSRMKVRRSGLANLLSSSSGRGEAGNACWRSAISQAGRTSPDRAETS